MKKIILPVVIAFLLLTSCKKTAINSSPYGHTQYNALGNYNSIGLPAYLIAKDSISPQLSAFINSLLPNGVNLSIAHPEFFTTNTQQDITLTSMATLYMTFVSQASGRSNSIAFYTYPTNMPPASDIDIKVLTYAFPNAGYLTPLVPGDKVKLGRFDAGTSIGFMLINNGWNINKGEVDVNAIHWATNDVLNNETDSTLKKHSVFINYPSENKTIIDFEDTDRSSGQSDNDFNDVVFYITEVN